MIAALVGETGWTIKYIQSLRQYEIDELLQAFIRLKTIEMPAGILGPPMPKTEASGLSGRRKQTTTQGMTSIPQILDAANMLEAQIKTDG